MLILSTEAYAERSALIRRDTYWCLCSASHLNLMYNGESIASFPTTGAGPREVADITEKLLERELQSTEEKRRAAIEALATCRQTFQKFYIIGHECNQRT